jgi:hypothetical protein
VSVYLRRDEIKVGMLVRGGCSFTHHPDNDNLYLVIPNSWKFKCADGFVLGQVVKTGKVMQINRNFLRRVSG